MSNRNNYPDLTHNIKIYCFPAKKFAAQLFNVQLNIKIFLFSTLPLHNIPSSCCRRNVMLSQTKFSCGKIYPCKLVMQPETIHKVQTCKMGCVGENTAHVQMECCKIFNPLATSEFRFLNSI